MNLLRQIVAGVWMVEDSTVQAALPLVSRLIKGEGVEWYGAAAEELRPFAFFQRENARYYGWSEAPEGSVAVHRIVGMITKFDQECGPRGTQSLMNSMTYADNQSSITAHLLEIDSGGGEATNIETVAKFIRNSIKKPVVAIVNGLAASAAYYIAAAADEVYASEETDLFGSIGVVMTFADFQPMLEAQGVVFHDVYADESSLKNKDFEEARKGNYEGVKKHILNPYAAAFISSIREFRPKLKDDDEVLKGQVYPAAEAKKIGLIDGVRTWEQAADRAVQLGRRAKATGSREAAANRQSNSSMDMKQDLKNINLTLGYELIPDKEGGVYLQGVELQKLSANLTTPAQRQEQATLGETLSQLANTVEQLSGTVEQLSGTFKVLEETQNTMLQSQQAIQGRLSRIEDRTPGASATLPKSLGDPAGEGGEVDAALKAAEENFNSALRAERRQ